MGRPAGRHGWRRPIIRVAVCLRAGLPGVQIVGNGEAAVVDTWWQTETGAQMITPLPGVTPTKPGSGEGAGAPG